MFVLFFMVEMSINDILFFRKACSYGNDITTLMILNSKIDQRHILVQGGPISSLLPPLFKFVRVYGPQAARNCWKSSCSPKKKCFHLESISDFPILFPKP